MSSAVNTNTALDLPGPRHRLCEPEIPITLIARDSNAAWGHKWLAASTCDRTTPAGLFGTLSDSVH